MHTFFCSAILFDMDGVLIDSTRSVSYQWLKWAEENQIPAETMLPLMHGRRTIEVVRLAAKHLDAEREARKIEKRGAGDHERVFVVPGATELLNSLSLDQWGIVTSATRYVATTRLQHFNLPMPRALVTADEVTRGKPDPEPYLKGAQLLGVKPADCLVIEDAPAGICSAHDGGMKAIAVASTFPPAELSQADAVAGSLRQIHVAPVGAQLRVEL
jgi:mannitol-1-/sugar-/sorbitol-6-phosphatase